MGASGGGIRADGVAGVVDEEAIASVTAIGGLRAIAAAVRAVAAGGYGDGGVGALARVIGVGSCHYNSPLRISFLHSSWLPAGFGREGKDVLVPVTHNFKQAGSCHVLSVQKSRHMLLSNQVLWQRPSERHSSAMWQHMLTGSPALQGRYWGFEGLRRLAVGGHTFSSSCLTGTGTDA